MTLFWLSQLLTLDIFHTFLRCVYQKQLLNFTQNVLLRSFYQFFFNNFRNSHHRCYIGKVFLKNQQSSQENTSTRVSFFNKVAGLRLATLFKKETPAQVFSCECCEIFKNTFFTEHLLETASAIYRCTTFDRQPLLARSVTLVKYQWQRFDASVITLFAKIILSQMVGMV